MQNKMSFTLFNEHKKKMIELLNNAQAYMEEHENDENFDQQSYEQEMTNKYVKLQEELLSFDLSEIPFESWQDLVIFSDSDYEPDFSKSKANIDFNILDFWGKGNFKNCNIRNLNKFGRMLNEDFFDKDTINANPQLFLSSRFDSEFKDKFYNCNLNLDDLITLDDEQIEELENKNINVHFENLGYPDSIMESLGLKNMVDLYKYSKADFEIVTFFLDSSNRYNLYLSESAKPFSELVTNIKDMPVSEMKQYCYDFVREHILSSKHAYIDLNDYPQQFIDENDDIFLLHANISDELRNIYYMRSLSTDDVIDNSDVFIDLPIENFMKYSSLKDFAENLGSGGLQYLLKNHKDVLNHLRLENGFYDLNSNFQKRSSIEESFYDSLKEYFCNKYGISTLDYHVNENGERILILPEWLSSLNFQIVEQFTSIEDLETYSPKVLLADQFQRKVIGTFGIDNLIRFDKETKFFSHSSYDSYKPLVSMNALGVFLSTISAAENIKIPDRDKMSYNEFTDIIAQCLNTMRKHNIFTDYPNYDFIEGEFRDKHPEIFIPKNAPEELKNAFYKNKINGDLLRQHKEYIPFLKDKDLKNVINGMFDLECYYSEFENAETKTVQKINFVDFYSKSFGNESLLNLIATYGNLGTILSDGVIDLSLNKEEIDKQYRYIVYKSIIKNQKYSYEYLKDVSEFVNEHPDIFLSKEDLNQIPASIREKFEKSFYERSLRFEHIRHYPELINVLKNKNLELVFGKYNLSVNKMVSYNKYEVATELQLIKVIGQDKFLELCSKYGYFLENIYKDLTILDNVGIDYDQLCEQIESVISQKCLEGKKAYNYLNAPEFLKQKMPNLFLDPNAPEGLQELFYFTNKRGLEFKDFYGNKDWLEYLKGKSVSTAFLRNGKYSYYGIKEYFNVFGDEKGLKLGVQRSDTVEQMIFAHKVQLMKSWYDKTGQKFIPDHVVMENFDISEADKFLASGANWSTLMKIKSFSEYPESRDAMLKLAYCFGVFDQDQAGMKKLQELLTGIPRFYKSNEIFKLKLLENQILNYNKILETSPEIVPTMPLSTLEYGYLVEELKKDGIEFNGEKAFSVIFSTSEIGNATLKINPQSHAKAMKYLRAILEENDIVLNGRWSAHQLFGGFELKYDKDFREFLLNNFDEIRNKPEHQMYISSIQKQFSEIKALNSNRTLTWDLAVSFVQANKYVGVNVGNDMVADISAIAGYTQEQFETLQEIYNYGKVRTFNSIPRIQKATPKYNYEMLRLDDPLALAIGTLSDCCQELGNVAEVCMEHSMVDKNGRVFVVKDNSGNIVAQSWVWRNKDVLCFDNIEIPQKAFSRSLRENPELGRKGFTDEIFGIYKQAARDLIEADEAVYRELLEQGKISQEQYDGLRLGKVTVGLGYNDIAESLKANSNADTGYVSRPLPFTEPVKLSRGLYISDSSTQYVLDEREGRVQYSGETLPVHNDTFVEYTNETFDEKKLLMLERLALVSKQKTDYMDTLVNDYTDKENIVSSLARNYGLNRDTTKIILNPNFAIIYDVNGNKVKIGELLYNFSVDNGSQQIDITDDVLMQMRLAFEQIANEKKIDVSLLDREQLEIYNRLENIAEEIDMKKGVSYGK